MKTPIGCELCGAQSRLTMALLRVAWEDYTVAVKVCTSCGKVAWRTAEALEAEREARTDEIVKAVVNALTHVDESGSNLLAREGEPGRAAHSRPGSATNGATSDAVLAT